MFTSALAAVAVVVALTGTDAKLTDARGPVSLLSYTLVWDAGNATGGYLRKGDTFVKTPYREVPVSPGGKWAAGVPDHRRFLAAKKIDLIDRASGKKYTVPMPAPVTTPVWSADGTSLLMTAYKKNGWADYTTIGFVTMNVNDRTPHLVKAGAHVRVTDWAVGNEAVYTWNANASAVVAAHKGLTFYALDGTRTHAFPKFTDLPTYSPSATTFATVAGSTDHKTTITLADAKSGEITGKVTGAFAFLHGWYDDTHLIVTYLSGRDNTTRTTKVIDLNGRPGITLIKEKLHAGPADYHPHLTTLNFARPK